MSRTRHGPVAQLLLAWSPLSLILVGYAVAGWLTASVTVHGGASRLGTVLHVTAPAAADRLLVGGVPSVWLQARLATGPPHWYDAVAAVVYLSHFVAIPLVTAAAWFRWRDRFAAWLAAVVAFTVLGVAGYVAYPAAPPWLAADLGVIGPVHRLSARGWEVLHLPWVGDLVRAGQERSNPTAAMPSLHAGAALLVVLFVWPVVARRWRAVLAAYPVLMGWVLVYTGEHYVVDVLTGWLVAAAGLALGAGIVAAIDRQRLTPPTAAPPGGRGR